MQKRPRSGEEIASLNLLHYQIGAHFEASRVHAGNIKNPLIAGGLLVGLALGLEANPHRWGAKEKALAAAGSLILLVSGWERLMQESNVRSSAAALVDAAEQWRPHD